MDMTAPVVILILAGLICFLLEILTPSFGILGTLGVLSSIAGVCVGFAISQTFGTVLLIAMIVLVPAYLWLLVTVLPISPVGKWLFLRKAKDATGAAAPIAKDYETLVGMTGTAETPLRPAGAVRVDGRRLVAAAESNMIERGARIKVIRSDGMSLIVSEVKDDSYE